MATPHNLPAIAGAAIISLFGGVLSLVSLSAAVVALPAGVVVEQLRQGEALPPATRIKAAQLSLRAGHIFEKGRYYSDALTALGRLEPKARLAALSGRSERVIVEDALRAMPASPHNWARRASLQLAIGDVRGARGSLETSILVGRFVPGLTVPRLAIIDALLRRAPDAELESLFADQVRLAARSEPDDLAAFADGGAAEGRTQRVLSSDFPLYNAYLKALMAHRGTR